ncbi:MAG: TadE/TadG family type IV pilus assembly protein [Formivibrio sp.]|nr:TadE/TadG family type IV pilus assembly protein [Formivibrio sp.]
MCTKRKTIARRKENGVAAVEFGLLIVFLLAIVTGIIEFGKAFWYYDALVKSTRDGARFLSLSRVSPTVGIDSGSISQAKDQVVTAVSAANVPGFTSGYVSVSCDPNCTVPDYVTVSISAYPITIGGWIPVFVPTGTTTWTSTLSPYTTMRYMR